jgi:hypothetical protein
MQYPTARIASRDTILWICGIAFVVAVFTRRTIKGGKAAAVEILVIVIIIVIIAFFFELACCCCCCIIIIFIARMSHP